MKINLPTKFTIARIAIVPFMVFAYLTNLFAYGKLIALVLFILAACTDFIDGNLARKNNQITNLGKFLDPIADKVLTMAALLLIVADKTVIAPYGVIFAIIIIGREFAVSGLRQMAASKNVIMAADSYGKIKTVVQDIALPVYMLFSFLKNIYSIPLQFREALEVVSLFMLTMAVILTILSGVNYFVKNIKVLKED